MRSERAGWVQALGRDIEAIKRLHQLERERSVTTRASAAREILASLAESARQPILSLDPQGCIRTWNAAAERIFGSPAREAATQTLDPIVPPEARMEKENLLTQMRRGEQPRCGHTTLWRKGGIRLEAAVYLSPVLDEAGKIMGASVIVCEKPPAGALPLFAKNEECVPLFPKERIGPGAFIGRAEFPQNSRLWARQGFASRRPTRQ